MKEKNGNPFQFGVVIDDSAFCNRKKEISFLKQQIENGYSTWLFSPRRFGKTSLVDKVFRETTSAICIYLDLYNIKSLDDFSRKYSELLARELFNWRDEIKSLTKKLSESFSHLSPGVSFDQFGNPAFSLNINKIELQRDIETILDVPDRISRHRKKRICVAFDEFQEISRIDPFLLNWMRSSFQRHREVSYIFLGSKQSMMEDIFSTAQSPFFEFATRMKLEVIDKTELSGFIREKFNDYGLQIKNQTIDRILEVSECQPHYTQFFSSVVFDLMRTGIDQDREDFSNIWLNRVMYSQTDIFQDIYDQLTIAQRSTLLAISKTGGSGIFSDMVRTRYDLPVSSSLTETIKALQKKALIYKSDKEYKFVNPVFREWLLTLL